MWAITVIEFQQNWWMFYSLQIWRWQAFCANVPGVQGESKKFRTQLYSCGGESKGYSWKLQGEEVLKCLILHIYQQFWKIVINKLCLSLNYYFKHFCTDCPWGLNVVRLYNNYTKHVWLFFSFSFLSLQTYLKKFQVDYK